MRQEQKDGRLPNSSKQCMVGGQKPHGLHCSLPKALTLVLLPTIVKLHLVELKFGLRNLLKPSAMTEYPRARTYPLQSAR